MNTSSDSDLIASVTSAGYNTALGLLARREHSVQELRSKLRSKLGQKISASDERCDSYSLNEVIATIVQKLEDDGYLSDVRFAESYTRARTRKGFGPKRIALELKEKGVSSAVTQQVLSLGEEIDLEGIYLVWAKKYRQLPDSLQEKAKQQNFLRYRGFDQKHIELLFRRLQDGEFEQRLR